MSDIRISHVQWSQDGISIGFIDLDDDVRVEGQVVRHTTFDLSNQHPDYREAIEKLEKRVVRLVEDAMEDYNASIPFTPTAPDDDADEKGMGE